MWQGGQPGALYNGARAAELLRGPQMARKKIPHRDKGTRDDRRGETRGEHTRESFRHQPVCTTTFHRHFARERGGAGYWIELFPPPRSARRDNKEILPGLLFRAPRQFCKEGCGSRLQSRTDCQDRRMLQHRRRPSAGPFLGTRDIPGTYDLGQDRCIRWPHITEQCQSCKIC